MPLTYRQVKDLYDQLHDAGAVSSSLPDWASEMGRLTNSDVYGAGLHDNWIKQASVGIDRALEATGIPQAGREFGGDVGSMLGDRPAGERVGGGLGRSVVNFLPLLIPGLGEGQAARLAGTGLLSGAESYTETGSPAAGVVSGITNAAMPGVAHAAEQYTLGKLGATALSGPITDAAGKVGFINQLVPKTLGQGATSLAAGQLTAAGLGQASEYGQDVMAGRPVHRLFSVETLLGLTLGQAPFAALYATKGGRESLGGKATRDYVKETQDNIAKTQEALAVSQAQDEGKSRTNLPDLTVNYIPNPKDIADTSLALATLRKEKAALADEATPDSMAEFDKKAQQELDLVNQQRNFTNGGENTVGGEDPLSAERINVVGTEHYSNPGQSRIVRVADDPANVDLGLKPGELIRYSVRGEPTPTPDPLNPQQQIYALPTRFMSRDVVDHYAEERAQKQETFTQQNPDLPLQEQAAARVSQTSEEIQNRPASLTRELTGLQDRLNSTTTDEELRQVVVDYNNFAAEHNIPVLDDKAIEAQRIHFGTNVKGVIRANTNKLMARVEERQKNQIKADNIVGALLAPRDEAKKTGVVGDEKAVALANDIHNVIATSKFDSSRINRLVAEWHEVGMPDGVEGLSKLLISAQRSGKGKVKAEERVASPEDKVVNKLEQAVKEQTPESSPLAEIRGAILDSILFDLPEDEKVDAMRWSALVEGGDIPEQFKGGAKAFLLKPHVREWQERFEELMRRAIASHSISKSLDQPGYGTSNASTTVDKNIADAKMMDAKDPAGFLRKMADMSRKQGKEDAAKGFEVAIEKLEHPYAKVPDSLLGFPKEGQTKPFEEQNWKFEQPVKVIFEDGTSIVDKVKGQNQAQALERAQRNWPTGKIYPVTEEEFQRTELSHTLSGPSATTLAEFTPFKPTDPRDSATMKDWGVLQGGAGIANYLSRSVDPFFVALGEHFLKYPELLKRITAEVWNMSGSRAFGSADGKVRLLFDSALLRADRDTIDETLAHELLHGLTKAEIDNPTNKAFADSLTQFREKLISRLNPADRAAFDAAIKSHWLDRFNQDLAQPEELHIDPRTRRVLYGLLNNDELITQGFTTTEMRKFMQSVPGEAKQTAWGTFTTWIRNLLGMGENIKGTAFSNFLAHTSNILQQGEFIASARNYVERYFKNKGLSPEAVAGQSQRALALILDGGGKESLVERAVAGGEPKTAAYGELKKTAEEGGVWTGKLLVELGYVDKSKGLDQLTTALLKGEHANPEDIMAMLPEASAKYVFERTRDAQELLKAVAGATKHAGPVGVIPNNIDAKAAVKLTKPLLDLEKEHQLAKMQILGMSGLGADGFVSKALDSADKLKDYVDPLAPKPTFMTSIEKLLALPAQVARQDPRFAEHFAKVTQQAANARKMRDDSLEALATEAIPDTVQQLTEHGVVVDPQLIGATLSKESQKRSERVVSTPKLTSANDQWTFANQKKNPGKEVVLPRTDEAVQKALAGLTPEEQNLVAEFQQKQSVTNQRMNAKKLGVMKEQAYVQGIKLLGRELSAFGAAADWNARRGFSQVALEAALTDYTNPIEAQAGQAKIAQLQQSLPAPVFNSLVNLMSNARDRIQLWQEQFNARPAWVSAKDYGRYRAVYFNKNGKIQRVSSDDESFVRDTAQAGQRVVSFEDRGNQSDIPDYAGLSPELLNRIQELERNSWDIQQLTPEQRKAAQDSQGIAVQLAREKQASGVPTPSAPGRNLNRGAEDLPYTSNFFSYMTSTANYHTRALLRDQHEALIAEPEVQGNTELKDYMQDYFKGYMAQDPRLAQQIKRVISTWFLGANMASALANPIGNAMRMISELTSVSGKALESYSRYTDAAKDVLRNWSGKSKWNTPDESNLMEEAARRGFRDYNLHDDNAIAQDTLATRYKQLIDQQRPQSLGSRLSTLVGNMGNASMWMFRMGDRFSSTLAILSAYRLYREQGLDHSAAQEKAFEFSHSVNDSGGRANRPVGPFSAQGEVPRSAALLGTTLQNFVLGSTFQLVRYLKRGLFRPVGITPAEVFSSRKAAIQMLSMQLGAAGVLGMPFVSGAIALLDKAFPELELNRRLRETVAGFFDSDHQQGSALSDMAMTGIPSMLGWDLQSRLSMGNTIPGVSEVNGFEPLQLFGPGVSLVSQFVKGSQRLAAGQGSPADWMPPSVKKLVDLVSSGGVVRDYKQRPILDDVTPGEKLGIGLGFNPQRLSNFNAAQQVTEQQDKVLRLRESQFQQGLAESAVKGEFGTVRGALLERQQQDQSFDPVESVRAIAQKAEDLTFPRDLRREGNSNNTSARAQLLTAFRLDPTQPSEVNRLAFRTQLEQRLGLSVSRSSDLVKAELMDRLRMTRPDATRSELRRAAEAAISRSTRQTQLLPEASQ